MFDHDSEEREAKRKFSRRALIVGGGQMLGFSALGWRLFQLQVLDEGRYDPLADENRTSLQVVLPKRGRIFDRRGLILADNEESFRVTITPALAGDVPSVLQQLRLPIPLRQEDLEAIAKRAKKQSRNTPITVASDLTFEQVAEISLLAPYLPGIRTEVAWKRKYRQGAAVGHVVGYVGSVERIGVNDDQLMRMPGMRVGKSGVEAGMEAILRGQGGTQKIEVDARGRMMRNLEMHDPKPGSDITLTIDTALQRRVLERLQQERRASCVVIELKAGEVVAMASTPGYDPSEVADGITDEMWQRMTTADDKPMLDRAAAGQYPPGSTFKMVTALAALHAGLVDVNERITCEGRFELADQTYRCWKRSGHGRMNLHQALRESCDVYFFEMSKRLGIDAIADMARSLGLGQVFDCGLLQQKAGLVPDADWKRGRWNAGWLAGETILAGIGQGYVLATPLQLAVMMARVATGKNVTPTLVRRYATGAAPDFTPLALHEDKLEAVRRGLVAVVNEEGGTGANASLGEGHVRVAGKTGTSQVSRASSDTAQEELAWAERDHALFVAYFPADAPRYAVSAIVEHGGGGGATAAPLVRDVIEAVLQSDPASHAALPDAGGNAPLAPHPEKPG